MYLWQELQSGSFYADKTKFVHLTQIFLWNAILKITDFPKYPKENAV